MSKKLLAPVILVKADKEEEEEKDGGADEDGDGFEEARVGHGQDDEGLKIGIADSGQDVNANDQDPEQPQDLSVRKRDKECQTASTASIAASAASNLDQRLLAAAAMLILGREIPASAVMTAPGGSKESCFLWRVLARAREIIGKAGQTRVRQQWPYRVSQK